MANATTIDLWRPDPSIERQLNWLFTGAGDFVDRTSRSFGRNAALDIASGLTFHSRLIRAGLHHEASLVRDAAALGLVWLEGTEATLPLRQAFERETVPELKQDLEDLIQSLGI